MSSVTVRGSAHASVRPDSVVVQLTVSHLDNDAGKALDEVAQRTQRLENLLVTVGLTKADWVTEGVQVGEEWQWRNDANVLVGYRATSGVAATLRDFAVVGALIRDAVRDCSAQVRALQWLVDPDNPTRSDLLGLAARDARRRATAYTSALGLRLGEVEAISESPLDHGGPTVGMADAVSFRSAKAGGGDEMSVSGGLLDLTADVHVRFAILPTS
jgi:uncharacterized protein